MTDADSLAPVDTFAPGFVADMPGASYHKVEALSATGAKKLLKSSADYRLMRTKPTTPTVKMQFGTAVHAAVLEPDTFASVVVEAPDVNKRTNAGRSRFDEFIAEHTGKLILPADDMARVFRCVDAVRKHPAAMQLLDGGEREGSLFWVDGQYKVPCKARFDARNRGGLIDLKTTGDASPVEFGKQAASLLYHLQAAHYLSGGEHVLDSTPEFFAFVVVESEPPHNVGCYTLPSAAILAGQFLLARALERYAAALATGEWPGYANTIDVLPFPNWALRFDV